jgi:hypothetical protein
MTRVINFLNLNSEPQLLIILSREVDIGTEQPIVTFDKPFKSPTFTTNQKLGKHEVGKTIAQGGAHVTGHTPSGDRSTDASACAHPIATHKDLAKEINICKLRQTVPIQRALARIHKPWRKMTLEGSKSV